MAKKPEQEPVAPIIIKKIDGGHHGHHGGAWKIALADMMTAMMAFFLLMWLLGATNESQRKSIADYFKPTPKSVIDLSKGAGSNGVLGGRSMLDDQGLPNAAMQTSLFETVVPPRMGSEDQGTADPAGDTAQDTPPPEDSATDAAAREAAEARRFEQLEEEIKAKLASDPKLAGLKDQVKFVKDETGLRIDIIDDADFSMFNLGTATFLPRAEALLKAVAASLTDAPNKMMVRGHTDGFGFAGGKTRNNWTLSAERAEATCALFESANIGADRFVRIEGAADTEPNVAGNPYDARNRRVSVTLQSEPRAAAD